jgi:hypothetical protein
MRRSDTLTRRRRTARLGSLVVGSAGVQALGQALGMVTGLVIIRETSTQQYAFYSLTVAVVAIAAVATESGLGNAMLSASRRRPTDSAFLRAVVVEADRWRRVLFLCSSALGLTALTWILLRNGASIRDCVVLSGGGLASLYLGTRVASTLGLLRVQGRFALYQGSTIAANSARALITASLFLSVQAGAVAAVAISATSTALQYGILRSRTVFPTGNPAAKDREYVRSVYGRTLPKILPMNLAIVLQGQLVFFIVGALGSTNAVAVIGAVSRYATAFAVVNVAAVLVLGSVLAHGSRERARLRVATVCLAIAAALALMVGTCFCSDTPYLDSWAVNTQITVQSWCLSRQAVRYKPW